MKSVCESPWFSVCLNMEHTSCHLRRYWYYENNKVGKVKELQKEVDCTEKAFMDKYFKKGEEIKDSD